jgi:LysR family nitrogen assimilation transcriptional regulator
MDTRRLRSFIVIVDTGSITRAAEILHIAQPALSQQVVALEAHFKRQLLIRSQQGVAVTEAGKAVYRHAQVILRQMEQAQVDAMEAGQRPAGRVSVGLAPFSAAASLSIELFAESRQRYPGILLHIVESVGQAYSQLIMTGRLEVALIHGAGPIKGVQFDKLLDEEMFLVAHPSLGIAASDEPLPIAELANLPMLLPPIYNNVRRAIENACVHNKVELNIIGELEAVKSVSRAVGGGLGVTISPLAVVQRITQETPDLIVRRITPRIDEPLSLCVADRTPLSEPAAVIRALLMELACGLKYDA